MSDELILELVQQFHQRSFLPTDIDGEFSYYVSTPELNDKIYKLVWLLEKDKLYIGVLTAFQTSRSKK